MIISGIAWCGYALPFRKWYVDAGSAATTRFGLLVFLRTNDGITGIGEASPVGVGNLAGVHDIVSSLEKIVPQLLDNHIKAADRIIAQGLPPALIFGLETALLDIRGQHDRVPLTALIGGKPAKLAVNATIVSGSPEQAASEAGSVAECGFSCVKLKVGKNTLEEDEAVVAAVRQSVGPEVLIRLDANQAWSVDQAIDAIKLFSLYNIEYVEQPVKAEDIAGMAKVRRAVRVPIAADESLTSIVDLQRLLEAAAADVFIIKAARLGGFKKSLRVVGEAVRRGHRVVVTTSLESGIGIAASAHLAAAVPPQPIAHGLATGLLLEDDLRSEIWLIEDGFLQTPAGHGLGVNLNAASLKKYSSGIIGSVGSPAAFEEYLGDNQRR